MAPAQASRQTAGMTKLDRVRWVTILSAALLSRLMVVLLFLRHDPQQWFFNQTTELGKLAESLLSGLGLSSPFGGSTGPSAFLAPGYPALVAFVFQMFGKYSRSAATFILFLQVMFAVGTVWVVMLAARKSIGVRVANIAGTIWAISPPLLFLPTLFWESALSTLCLTAALAWTLSCAETPRLWKWAAMGAGCAVAMLVNPALLLAFLCLSVWALYRNQGRISWRAPLLMFATWFVVFGAWPIRNAEMLHAFIPMRSNLGYELWQGNRTESNGEFTPALHPNVSEQEFARYASLGEVGYMREKSTLAKGAIRANPLRFLGLSVRRFFRFWLGLGAHQQSALIIAHIVFTTALGLAGLVLLFRRRSALAFLFLGPLLVFPLPYYVTHADFRFRLVLDPLMTMLTAHALAHYFKRGVSNPE